MKVPLSFFRVDRFYDSHLHLLGTGEFSTYMNLTTMKAERDIEKIKVKDSVHSGWVFGFGWDQNKWNKSEFPTSSSLDKKFPDQKAYMVRADGHAVWVNSQVLEELQRQAGYEKALKSFGGSQILLNENNEPTGIFLDQAKALIDELIPPTKFEETQKFYLKGVELFHLSGVTHVRDLSCSPLQWEVVTSLDEKNHLFLAVEQFFDAEDFNHIDRAFELSIQAKRESFRSIRPKGVKVYYDGAMGSNGAYLSENYLDSNSRGIPLMKPAEFKEILRRAWELDLEVAVHGIGDQAIHEIVQSVSEVTQSTSLTGLVHIEHASLIRNETLQRMKGLPVICHFQPCHWLTDQEFLPKKIPNYSSLFNRWGDLEEIDIPIWFGSDSPIETPGLLGTYAALESLMANGFQSLKEKWTYYHSHPDQQWCPNSYSEFSEGMLMKTVFQGKTVYESDGP